MTSISKDSRSSSITACGFRVVRRNKKSQLLVVLLVLVLVSVPVMRRLWAAEPPVEPSSTSTLLLTRPFQAPGVHGSSKSPVKAPISAAPNTVYAGRQPAAAAVPELIVYYSHARQDRSGAALQDMLLAHATAWSSGYTYGGACVSADYPAPYQQQLQDLLTVSGLDSLLRFACPPPNVPSTTHLIWDREFYFRRDTAVWTVEWRHYVRSFMKLSTATTITSSNVTAVHIRRGDVNPCIAKNSERYLPNAHYLKLIKDYAPLHDPVMVYSESDSLEPWDEFLAECNGDSSGDSANHYYNCHLELDTTDLNKAWMGLVTARTIVLSKSSFSLTAAILSNATTVVYTPFWHEPAADWQVASRDLVRESQRAVQRLQQLHCA